MVRIWRERLSHSGLLSVIGTLGVKLHHEMQMARLGAPFLWRGFFLRQNGRLGGGYACAC